MMISRLLRLGLLSAALCSGAAGAVGFGELSLHSHIGEPLRAEVPVSAGGEPLDAACFSLGSVPGADYPVVSAGRIRLLRIGQDYRLIITASKAIDEPVAIVSLRAGCGLDLQRDYVLLPGPPAAAEVAAEGEAPRTMAALGRHDLRRLSEAGSPDSDTSDQPAARARRPQRATPKAKATLPRDTLAGIGGKDKVVLGAALDDLPPPGAGDPLAAVNALDERLLKMETTLHLLHQEVDKLDAALALNAESRAMRQKLQDQQVPPARGGLVPSAQAATPQAPAPAESGHDGWLELLLGLLLGGSVSAGVAHLVSRRQDQARAFADPCNRQTPA